MNDQLLADNMSQNGGDFRRTLTRLLGFLVISLVIVSALSPAVAAHTGDDGFHHHDGWMGAHDGMGGWMVGGPGFLWTLLWTVVLLGIPGALAYLVFVRRETSAKTTDDDALRLLRRRYAEGDIDEEEFDTRRAKLVAEQH